MGRKKGSTNDGGDRPSSSPVRLENVVILDDYSIKRQKSSFVLLEVCSVLDNCPGDTVKIFDLVDLQVVEYLFQAFDESGFLFSGILIGRAKLGDYFGV